MSDGVRVEVRVRGRLGGDLLTMVGGLDARLVPRHTVLTVPCDDDESALLAVVDALGRAGLELERVTVHGVRPAGHHGGGAAA